MEVTREEGNFSGFLINSHAGSGMLLVLLVDIINTFSLVLQRIGKSVNILDNKFNKLKKC